LIYILQSLANEELNEVAIRDPLREAIMLGAQLGFRRTFLYDLDGIGPQLARRRHVAPDFVDSLLKPQPQPVGAPNAALIEPLSKTQLVILGLVATGLSNQDIANKLGITVGTTKWHLNQIYHILNVSSRTQAIAEAHRLNLL
jgi:LuxR family maltose regulon positive regulatory protein